MRPLASQQPSTCKHKSSSSKLGGAIPPCSILDSVFFVPYRAFQPRSLAWSRWQRLLLDERAPFWPFMCIQHSRQRLSCVSCSCDSRKRHELSSTTSYKPVDISCSCFSEPAVDIKITSETRQQRDRERQRGRERERERKRERERERKRERERFR